MALGPEETTTPTERKSALASILIENYRSCLETRLTFERGLTALIGPNGTGKTNLMNALLLLTPIRHAYGSQDDLTSNRCKVEATFEIGSETVEYKSMLEFSQEEAASDRVTSADESYKFRTLNDSRGWKDSRELDLYRSVFYSSESAGHVAEAKRIPYRIPDRIFITRQNAPKRKKLLRGKNKVSDSEIELYRKLLTFRRGIKYYSASQFTNPQSCPTSFEIDQDQNGRLSETFVTRRTTHTRLLYDIFQSREKEAQNYSTFVSLIGSEGIGLIDALDWQEVELSSQSYEVRSGGNFVPKVRQRKLIIPLITIGKTKLTFNQLSEGTFRTIAMLFYIMTDNSTLLLLEEPEVCVHHGLLRSVLEIIRSYSASKQIVISTHSEAVLDSLKPEQIRVVERMSEEGTKARSLDKLMSRKGLEGLKHYLETVGGLGEYWRQSGFS